MDSYAALLELVKEAGADPSLAYQARNRLRRAIAALERGNSNSVNEHGASPPQASVVPAELIARIKELAEFAPPPSESFLDRWAEEWPLLVVEVDAALKFLREDDSRDG